MASSTSLGSRSSRSTISSYSKSVSPSWRCLDGDVLVDMRSHRLEDLEAIGRAGESINRVLGVGHQPEDITVVVAHPGDVVLGAVRVLAGGVTENHVNRLRGDVATGEVLRGD